MEKAEFRFLFFEKNKVGSSNKRALVRALVLSRTQPKKRKWRETPRVEGTSTQPYRLSTRFPHPRHSSCEPYPRPPLPPSSCTNPHTLRCSLSCQLQQQAFDRQLRLIRQDFVQSHFQTPLPPSSNCKDGRTQALHGVSLPPTLALPPLLLPSNH